MGRFEYRTGISRTYPDFGSSGANHGKVYPSPLITRLFIPFDSGKRPTFFDNIY